MYVSPKAKVATAEDLLASMDEAGVDVSVALGFAWREHDLCVRHNDYLLESAAKSGGRIVPFCTVNAAEEGAGKEVERCAQGGARGIGELRPESQGWDLGGAACERLADVAARQSLPLLFHVTEPVGHAYPGKGGCDMAAFYRFVAGKPGATVVGAHLGGGLPFYAAMTEVREALANTYVDTAAQPYLYRPQVYEQLVGLVGAERILLGSDFPLISQRRQIDEVRLGIGDEQTRRLILGGNAERLLGLGDG
jgi:predicted TIM-barrel fold metal-dependent hydrolase